MADEIKYDSTQPVRSQASATYTPTGLSDQNNLNAYNDRNMQQLQNVYNTAQQNTNAALKTAYDQNMSTAQAARDKITPQYQQAQNQLAAQNEVQRRNLNMQGAANGLNTGAGSQLALGQSMAYQRNAGNLARSEQEALGQADRGIADLQMNYQNAVAEAAANNNYKLAAAMLDEYQNQYNRQKALEDQNYQRQQQAEQQAYQRAFNEENRDYERRTNEENRDYTRTWNQNERDYERQMNEAQQRANFGDFSAYKDIYNEDTANAMELMWALQNPDAAWAAGKLKAEDYVALTGRNPSQPAGDVSGYYGGIPAADTAAATAGSGSGSLASGSGGSSSSTPWNRFTQTAYTRGAAGDTAYYGPPLTGNSAGNQTTTPTTPTNNSGNSWGRNSNSTNNTNPIVSLYNNTLGKLFKE